MSWFQVRNKIKYIPSIDMPTLRHLLNRHDLQVLRFSGVIGHSFPKKQRGLSFLAETLLKKPFCVELRKVENNKKSTLVGKKTSFKIKFKVYIYFTAFACGHAVV